LVPGTSFDASLLEVIPRYPIGPFSPGKGLEHLVPTPSQSFCFLFMNLIIFLVLAIYFDKIVPNSNGSCSHPLFFLFPSTYGFKSLNTTVNKTLDDFPDMKIQAENEDPDVSEERQECLKKNPEEVGLLIQSIHKRYLGGFQMFLSWLYSVFGKNYLFNAPEKRPAIHEVSFALEKGQLLSLLGSNGAGKTSLIKILSGSSPSTLGNAWIFGKSVYSQIDEVQKIIGICPQFDVLLKDLSAWEHIKLFCGIRGISDDKMKEIAKTRLEHMRLWKVKDQNAGQYSGGMKRRLSVILSTLGDPMCVFLDEPTTGMDPVNRRHVWTFLQKFKENRIVILTTHSMEEVCSV
jgi:ABC-type multidrug transport system ATPase subunit